MSRNPFARKTVGFYQVMDTSAQQSYDPGCHSMEYRPIDQSSTMISPTNVDQKKAVYFPNSKKEQEKENKRKYFTQKYGQDQMKLIRKRLAIEDWVFDQLRDLYDCENAEDDHNCKLELEEVLNYDTDLERRAYALGELTDAKKPEEDVFRFVDELVQKAKTL